MYSVNNPVCPRCNRQFLPDQQLHEFIDHVRSCEGNSYHPHSKNPNQPKQQYYYEKIPVDPFCLTKFKWEKKKKMPINASQYSNFNAEKIKTLKLSFQERELWFRQQLQKNRISWTQGAEFMNINQENLLIDSINQAKKVNMLKEVKINFKGEKVNDAGGLLREWTFIVIKQIFNLQTGIFSIANTEDIMYKLKWDEETDEFFSKEILILFGIVLAKAIFEKIPINSYIDRTIIRQLCGGQVRLDDIYGFDEELYRNWKHLLQNQKAEELDTYFVIHSHSGETLKQVEILPDGKDLLVNDENKHLFVDLCIQILTGDKVHRSINSIREGIQRVFPCHLLSVFQPYEVEMLVYGVPFIDIQEWFDNTEYRDPYSKTHKVIQWFWNILETFDQEQLGKILHFCTGSSRTPIHGFSKLESNRGNYSKFLIVSQKYDKANPFPKGHTCFNRLELPMYPTEQILKKYLISISKSELDGIFGLD